MTDLVQRLQSERSPLCLEAAREIERTAAMLREAKAEIIRLRDAKRRAMQAKALVEYLERTDPEGAPIMEPVKLPVPAWLANPAGRP